jgi:hypothetical protein
VSLGSLNDDVDYEEKEAYALAAPPPKMTL